MWSIRIQKPLPAFPQQSMFDDEQIDSPLLPGLRHSGTAIVSTIRGRWKYLERDWA